MIRALLSKDLKLVARDPAFRTVALGYLLVFLTAGTVLFTACLAGSESEAGVLLTVLFPRIALLQAALLAAAAPWLVFRFGTHDGAAGMAPLSAELFARPRQLLLARLLAIAIFLAELQCLALPVFSLAILLGATTMREAVRSLAFNYLFVLLVAVIASAIDTPRRHWLLSWLAAYLLLPFLAYGMQQASGLGYKPAIAPAVVILIALISVLSLLRADRSLVYLKKYNL